MEQNLLTKKKLKEKSIEYQIPFADLLEAFLQDLSKGDVYGQVLRAKGMIPSETEGEWYYFDLVPEEYEIRKGQPDYTGKVCVIGAKLDEEALKKVFHK